MKYLLMIQHGDDAGNSLSPEGEKQITMLCGSIKGLGIGSSAYILAA